MKTRCTGAHAAFNGRARSCFHRGKDIPLCARLCHLWPTWPTSSARRRLSAATSSTARARPTARSTSPKGPNELYYYDEENRFAAIERKGSALVRTRIWFGDTEYWFTGSGAAEKKMTNLSLGATAVARIDNEYGQRDLEYSFHNGLGHLMGAVESNGTLTTAYVYGPFGELLSQSGETSTHLRRFNGKEADQLSRLDYYGYRYYDPLSLTWTQADPLFRVAPDIAYDQPRMMSLYMFSGNNPVRYVDPDGRRPDTAGQFQQHLESTGEALSIQEYAANVGPPSAAESFLMGLTPAGRAVFLGQALVEGVQLVADLLENGVPDGDFDLKTLSPPPPTVAPTLAPGPGTPAPGISGPTEIGVAEDAARATATAPKASAAGKMQQEVARGQAPRDVKRVDRPHVDGQEPHVHFCNGTACNKSGTTHDAHKGAPNPPTKTREWLEKHGWTPPPKE